jgi:hypothetical protein
MTLVERLREVIGNDMLPVENDLLREAADRIEALEKALLNLLALYVDEYADYGEQRNGEHWDDAAKLLPIPSASSEPPEGQHRHPATPAASGDRHLSTPPDAPSAVLGKPPGGEG